MKVNVFVLVGVGDKEEEAGSKGKKSKEPWLAPMAFFWFHWPSEAISQPRQKERKLNCDLESYPF